MESVKKFFEKMLSNLSELSVMFFTILGTAITVLVTCALPILFVLGFIAIIALCVGLYYGAIAGAIYFVLHNLLHAF